MKTQELILEMYKRGKAVPAFNIPHIPMMEPIIRASIELNCIALIEVARLEWEKFKSESPEKVAEEFYRIKKPEYIRLHLDHVPVIDEDNIEVEYVEILKRAINCGFQSIMLDGSRLELNENIRHTAIAAELAHKNGIACEAELGAVLGHENKEMPSYEEIFKSGEGFTKINEAQKFIEETECDWLSVAVGNIHGAISKSKRDKKKVEAKINIEHLSKLSNAVKTPLVLHGGSGINVNDIRKSIKNGIAKINIGTELRQIFEKELENSKSVIKAQDILYKKTYSMIEDVLQLNDTSKYIDIKEEKV